LIAAVMNLRTLIQGRPRVAIDALSSCLRRPASGQSLVEVAVFLPVIFLCAAYAVDFGYFFIVAANLTSSARSAAEYSIQGYSTPGQASLPSAGPSSAAASVSYLALGDFSGIANSGVQTSVQVCSKSVGITGNLTNCSDYGPSVSTNTATAAQTDPEAPTFLLNRVDVTYTVEPPIPLTFFSVSLLPTLSFHRFVSMRVMD
jgi:Flp pilus assembly protein TadG